MPPKKKTGLTWLYCSTCNCNFSSEFEKQHTDQCSEICKVQASESITGNCLALKPVANCIGEDDLKPVNQLYTIYMNPDVMALFNIFDLDYVEVGGEFVATVLPDRKVSKSVVEVPDSVLKTHLKKDKLQKISVIRDVKIVKHVELFTKQEMWIERKENFRNYLRFMLDDMHLRKGFTFSTSYLNWDFEVAVTSLSAQSDEGEPDRTRWFKFSSASSTLDVRIDGDDDDDDYNDIFSSDKPVTFDDLGGYDQEKQTFLRLLRQSLNADRATSCLIFGRKGCGKSSFGNAVGRILPTVTFKAIGCLEVMSYYEDKTTDVLKSVKKLIKKKVKNVFFFDDLDELCGKEANKVSTEVDLTKQVAQALEYLFDHPDVCFVLASCKSPDKITPEVLSRFNERVQLRNPSREERLEIFRKHGSWIGDSLDRDEIRSVTDVCHGFVAGNMVLMSSRAEMKTLARHQELLESDPSAKVKATVGDLNEAYEFTKSMIPDLHLHSIVTSPVYWDDIVGYDDLKLKVKMAFKLPLTNPEQFKSLGLTQQRGILLYGPPGCCKTMIARAIATEFKMNFIAVRGSDLLSMYVGESEKNVNQLFSKARTAAPSLIFFDEIDSVATKRSSSNNGTNGVLSALLTEMDGLESLEGVAILAATNKPGAIDKALLRYKRLGQSVYVRLPCSDTRRLLLKKELGKMCTSPDIDIECLVEKTEMFSGDELVKLCQQAGYKCLLEDLNGVLKTSHFLAVLKTRLPITTHHSLKEYEEYEKAHD